MSGMLFSVIAIVMVMPVFFPMEERKRREWKLLQRVGGCLRKELLGLLTD